MEGDKIELLYTNILPLGIKKNQQTIIDCFSEQMKKANRVEIAVAYTSFASIRKIETLVEKLRH